MYQTIILLLLEYNRNACSVNYELSFLTNSSLIPLITERVQRLKEVRHVMMMRQSNSTVRFMFLAAERTQKPKVVTNERDAL